MANITIGINRKGYSNNRIHIQAKEVLNNIDKHDNDDRYKCMCCYCDETVLKELAFYVDDESLLYSGEYTMSEEKIREITEALEKGYKLSDEHVEMLVNHIDSTGEEFNNIIADAIEEWIIKEKESQDKDDEIERLKLEKKQLKVSPFKKIKNIAITFVCGMVFVIVGGIAIKIINPTVVEAFMRIIGGM